MVSVRELPPLRHTIELETPSGRRYRWALDEPEPEDVPGGLTHSSTMPGGYEQAGCVLAREPGVTYDDLIRLSTATVRDHAGGTVGEYRLERTPRTSGDQMAISPDLVGWQAHLGDDKNAVGLIVDRDLGRWAAPGRQALIDALGAFNVQDSQVLPDSNSGLPTLELAVDNSDWTVKPPTSMSVYPGVRGIGIATIYADLETNAGTGNPNWHWQLYAGKDDRFNNSAGSDYTGSGELRTSTPGAGYHDFGAPASGKRSYALAQMFYDITEATSQPRYYVHFRKVAVYGDHGLTRRGADPGGFYASDVIAWILQTWAPLLNFTTGSEGTIRPSSFVIPHLVWPERTDGGAGEMVRQTSRFELQDWAVWDKRTFYFNARGQRGRNWRGRVGSAKLEETGPQVDRLWNSVIVQYRDEAGVARTIGPPGSGADTETADLQDADSENEANQLGIQRRDLLQMETATVASATKVGQVFLREAKFLDSSGRATLAGHVEDDRGVVHPFSHVRAGDTVTFVDAADTRPRRIVKASHNHDERACTVDLDAPPEGLQALLEDLGVGLVPLGL